MKRTIRKAWLASAIVLAVIGTWGCVPSAPGAGGAKYGASTAAADDSSYQDDLMPAATPDPVPDPEAGQTSAPGAHLDVIGSITALEATTITVDGVRYNLTASTEVKGTLALGDRVKLEYVTNADGSRAVIEAKTAEFFDDSASSSSDDGY
ncbi:MAG: DUF5666 domain-containing protein [Chloroflexota bacterium]